VDGANRNSEFANQDLPSPAKSGRLRGLSPSHPLFQPLNGIVYTGKFDNAEIQQIVNNNLVGKSQARYFSPGQVGSSALPIAGVDLGPRDVLVFHSTHCPYCTKQMPDVLNYARSNPNVNVWVITAIQISKPEELEAQFKGHPANLKLISSKDPMPFMQYNIQGTPTNLWVRDGKIVQAKTGYNPETFKGSGF